MGPDPSLSTASPEPISDLEVEPKSDALAGKVIDVVVSGSIAAVESVRFIRALRRLGAAVVPWLTDGGAQFVTPMALAWAAGQPTRRGFAGEATHIAVHDAMVVAPASANFLGHVAAGLMPSAATALAASYLGQRRPLLLLPTMHGSLKAAPPVARNLDTLAALGARLLEPRLEEGKAKFPDPATLADEVAHGLNHRGASVLITLGTTRAAIDSVRYVSNYSSGRLGSLIAEELYRQGLTTRVVAGPAPVHPRVHSQLDLVTGNADMEAAARQALAAGASAAVFAASVMDFLPAAVHAGKIASRDHERLTLELRRTHKLIGRLDPPALADGSRIKVGFKLETGLTPERARQLAEAYMADYGLSLMVVNDLADVDLRRHRATVFERGGGPAATIDGKEALARTVARHIVEKIAARSEG